LENIKQEKRLIERKGEKGEGEREEGEGCSG